MEALRCSEKRLGELRARSCFSKPRGEAAWAEMLTPADAWMGQSSASVPWAHSTCVLPLTPMFSAQAVGSISPQTVSAPGTAG